MDKKKENTNLYFHGCSYSSIQSIIHYGFHLTNTSYYGLFSDNFHFESIDI